MFHAPPVTPAIPPGLGLPHGHPSPAVSHSLAQGTLIGRQTPPAVAVPVTPLIPPSRLMSSQGGKTVTPAMGSEAKKTIQALALESGLSKDIASQASKSKSNKLLEDEDFPALDTRKPSGPPQSSTAAAKSKPTSTKAATVAAKKPVDKFGNKPSREAVAESSVGSASKPESRANQKKPTPGVLNIAVPTKTSQARLPDSQLTADKPTAKDSAFPALPTPTMTSVSSPISRNAPKTLRVVPTPKSEVPPPTFAGAAGGAVFGGPSLRSAVSMRPETPASELISDSASIISASISASRTSSPPPTKVGTAPVRSTTKSQQRKARKEALKKDAAVITVQPKQEAEVELGPILGRKKKQKKEMTGSSTATPVESRSGTPVPDAPQPSPVKESKPTKELKPTKEVKSAKEGKPTKASKPTKEAKSTKDTKPAKDAKSAKDAKPVREESSTYRSTAHETTTLTEEKPPQRKKAADIKGKAREAVSSEQSLPDSTMTATAPATQPLPSPASTLLDLQSAGVLPKVVDNLAFAKPVPGLNDRHRHDPPPSISATDIATPIPTKSIVTEEDQAALLAGKPVRKVIDGVRILLTPNGDCVRNLSEEEEDTFLELQARVAEAAASPAAFVSSRHEPAGGFSLIKGRAVPNGPPGYFPQAPGAYPSDPVSKIQREEAIYYINQYVLPRLNLGTINLEFPGSWKSTFPDGKVNVAATVANLNSFAPWIYRSGPGADDTAPPELSYPAPIGGLSNTSTHPGLASVLEITASGVLGPSPDAVSAPPSHSNAGVAGKSGPTMAPSPFGSVPLMSLEDAEQGLAAARKETEKLEKSLNQLIKRNRRLFTISSGGGSH